VQIQANLRSSSKHILSNFEVPFKQINKESNTKPTTDKTKSYETWKKNSQN